MKLTSIIFLVLPYFVFGQDINTLEFRTVNNSEFSISYPSNWELKEHGIHNTRLIVLSEQESSSDKFRESVNLIVQDLTGFNYDLDTFAAISKEQAPMMIPNFNLISEEKVVEKDRSFYKVFFTGDNGSFQFKFEQYYFVVHNRAYILTLTTEKSKFEVFRSIGERILNSFKLF
jgi:hypothetical protein